MRNGDIHSNEDSGLNLNQVNPARYPTAQTPSTVTREQVKSNIATAVRTGNVRSSSSEESGQKLNQLYPARYTNTSTH